MSKDKESQRQKLKTLFERLESGKDVQNRDLRRWLSVEEYADYEYDCKTQVELRNELKNKPNAVTEYEVRLRKATFAYNKGEGASLRSNSKAAQKHFAQADTLFERLHVYLDEIIAADAGLRDWFDRDLDSSTFGLTPGTVPMVITSRSLENDGGGLLSNKRSKRDIKLDAVEWAIRGLEREDDTAEQQAEAASKLRAFLKQMEDDDF